MHARFEMYSILQRRRRALQESSLSREAHLDLAPAHMDAEGEQFYERLLSRESSMVELSAARLMGNFIFLNDAAIPIQTQSALLRVVQEHPNGKFYSLGDDVNCLFYIPAGGEVVDEEVCPLDAFNTYMDYMKLTGRRFNPGYNQVLSIFYRTLESRKPGLEGRWFQVKGERQADAFLRRLKADDPHRPVYEEYVGELKDRVANKKELSEAEVTPRLLDVERKYRKECIDFDTLIMSMNEEISSEVKEKAPEYEELMADGNEVGILLLLPIDAFCVDGMTNMMVDGSIVAIDAETQQGLANQQQLFSRMTDFETSKDKFIENVNNSKTGLDTKRH
ncbi:conserved hypothetical protein [Perkinsus marinus ATCC 50983]|uniref:Uncharacterized protein n=1 Tax=Perkinsus marinus (strain ATCC 50983 / TXsc) TaxID=423536 RepID=C5LS94_PERM5|nr:conserved hypothetical protein [Perkinsus marinus ATCC 50983]EER00399.1 conserved hypothetical protein [Perkinsus marinus ATCC 50983]|eukprot:XP_002767681.1 conserved hypothetical protein [Perkinsus marinus ATCC 50983]